MTILAGMLARDKSTPFSAAACDAIRRVISRNPADTVKEFRDERVFLAKVDIGAYGEPAFLINAGGSVSMLAGEPLVQRNDRDLSSRTQDLHLLHTEWDQDRWEILSKTRGVYCAVHYQPARGKLTLMADKLGIRPLYYWKGRDFVFFATALRILEELTAVPKEMDLRGVSEIASFGFPLSDRTPYTDMFLLKAAEVIQFQGSKITRFQYWRWDRLAPSTASEQVQLKEAFDRFDTAIRIRLRGDKTTFGFLSGGLDSRCITAVLRSHGTAVHTCNWAPPGTQDQVFAAEFARKVGTIHQEIDMKPQLIDTLGKTSAVVEAWKASKDRQTLPAERPMLAWSGDGGSVGVGHVYLNQRVVDLMRAGKQEEAIDGFLREQKISVVKRLLRPPVSAMVANVPRQGIGQELDDIHSADPARNFHLFLMLNDQHRHLAGYFESIDVHRLELHLPFYDSHFLEAVLSSPIDLCLRHLFYIRWLDYFPPVVKSVPWQAYPGHEPCPVPTTKTLGYQWDDSFSKYWASLQRKTLLQQAREMLRANNFPDAITNRNYLRLATWIYWTRLDDYGYVIRFASTYYKYWALSGGRYVLPGAVTDAVGRNLESL